MEYRIKVIEKYSGKKQFIPQFRDEAFFSLKNIVGVVLFPIILVCAIAHPGYALFVLNYFFINWKGIEYDEIDHKAIKDNCFLNDDTIFICPTLEDAEDIIKTHQKVCQGESLKKWEEEKKKKANKTMKTSYINI